MTDFDPSNTTLMGTGAVAHPLSKKSTWLADRSFQLEILRQTALRHLGQFLQLHQRGPEPGCSADEASAAYELAREQIRYDLTELSAFLREELHRSQRRYGEIALIVL